MRFDSAIATAKRLIEKNGQLVQWNQATEKTDSNQPWKAEESTPKKISVRICFVPVKDIETRKLIKALTGTEVPVGQLAGLMAPQSFYPSLEDSITRTLAGKTRTLKLRNADPLAPNEQIVLWVLELYET